jgi:HK97 family phage major capsid protein
LTAELAFSLANLEDTIAWSADGTSTYFGMQGVLKKIVGPKGAVNAASGHDLLSEIDATDLGNLLAALPSYAMQGAKFYCSQTAFALSFCKLASGNGGIGVAPNGNPTFWGFEIVRSNLLPNVTSTLVNLPMILFGNMSQAGTIASDARAADSANTEQIFRA